ncbi:MAG TPA: amidase family protein [Rhodopila sp.]|uniref:amidase family protein n=1 Tax=Rhodopila sp. TaxID=2480087 RepID=UPI002B902698|nr:amidase family protein [Rhodopila sp.]HVY16818.1 amidase family protein [Rhodopila sp.]
MSRQRLLARTAADALATEDRSLPAARLRGLVMSHPAWIETSRLRGRLRVRWQALFRDIDLLLCPPMPTVAFPHDHSPWTSRTLAIDGKTVPYENQIAWSAPATLCGLPATVAPIARSGDGLPIGVQIVGGYLQDLTTIAFAGLLEQAFGGLGAPPNLG